MKRPTILLAATLLAASCQFASAPRAHGQALEFFDYFFSDNAGQPAQNFNLFDQWNVTNGSVDFVGGNVPGAFFYSQGGRFVDLGGSTGDPGAFTTRIPIVLIPGNRFTVTVSYVNTERLLSLGGPGAATQNDGTDGRADSALISIDGKSFTITSDSSAFQTATFDFTATGSSSNLTLQDLGSLNGTSFDNSGIGIDAVGVTPFGVPLPVPEPSTWALLGIGVVGLVLTLHRCATRV